MPTGKRFWRLRYSEDGARRKLTLGQYPAVSLSAEWSEVDLERSVWEIPEEKMKKRRPHAIPLSRQAVVLLAELRPLTGRWRYVFPSARNDGRPMSENAVRVALRSMGFSNEEMTAHGFRSLGSTALNPLGYRADVIEAASVSPPPRLPRLIRVLRLSSRLTLLAPAPRWGRPLCPSPGPHPVNLPLPWLMEI